MHSRPALEKEATVKLLTVSVGVVIVSMATTAIGDTIHVNGSCGNDAWTGLSDVCVAPDGPKATIQAGISAAVDGDEILVADGLYVGVGNRAMAIGDKLIAVRSTGGADACVIDCELQERAFFVSGPAVVQGFTIRNGQTMHGGAMLIAGDATIADCVFENNTADGGGAMYVMGSSPTITRCTFTGNSAEVYDGGALYNLAGNPELISCLMIGNSASQLGGAIFSDLAFLTLVNCTISENAAYVGGGITNYAAVEMTLTSSIVWQNYAEIGEGVEVQIRSTSSAEFVNYSCVQDLGDAFGGEGNIEADPLFVDTDGGDFHLQACSPAVNAGDPGYVPEPGETDIDGDDRVINGTVDMGADEVTEVCRDPCPWDCAFPPDGEVGIEEFLAVLGTWGQIGVPCDFDGGGVGITDFLKVLGTWGLCP